MKRKWFRRSWQIFLKYVPGLLIAGFISWGFVILYKAGNWSAFSALATLVLALGAFWSIRENRRIRDKDRELEVKALALEEIKAWALEFNQIVFLTGISYGRDPETKEIGTRFTNVLYQRDVVSELSNMFSGELKAKITELAKVVSDFNSALISSPREDDKLMFVANTEKRSALVKIILRLTDDLLRVVTQEKVRLYRGQENYLSSAK